MTHHKKETKKRVFPATIRHRLITPLLILGISCIAIWQIAVVTERKSLHHMSKEGELRVNLYASSLRATLEKYRHLPYVLARDNRIIGLLHNELPSIQVSPHLEDFGMAADALIFILDGGGTTVATSNWRSEQSLMGHNFSFRPYFTDAMNGNSGGYYAVGMRTNQPGFFLSYPVRFQGAVLGVIAVKVNLEAMQQTWRESGETVIVSDASGVLFLTSKPEWKYYSLRPLPRETLKKLQALQYINYSLPTLKMTRKTRQGFSTISLEGKVYLEQSIQLPEYGWRLHYLSDYKKVNRDVNLFATITTIGTFLVLLTYLFIRERRHRLLSLQEARSAQAIKEINEKLRHEITERKKTEENLLKTQDELIQAGKLAALGRMSAAIAHELNQPVTAIRTFTASSKVLLERKQTDKVFANLDLIKKLTERMSSITGQLKTFARKSRGKEEVIDINKSIAQVLELMQPQIEKNHTILDTALTDSVIHVMGDSLQIEQVLSNLILNSLDAMKLQQSKILSISTAKYDKTVHVIIADSGEGINEEANDNLFDPFFTTKDVGEGLGLGLSISYGIVKEMGGTISARNKHDGGAIFTVELPLQGCKG